MIYKNLIRPLLFKTNPEWIHSAGIHVLQVPLFTKVLQPYIGIPGDPVELWGLTFRNRLGMAAGFDKNAEIVPALYHLGFGFTEVGTITFHAQPGNEKPRIFRYPKHQALINRLGFPNEGATTIAKKLKQLRQSTQFPEFPIGINLGKSKKTGLEDAAEDYLSSFKELKELGDFFVVNVSSPNTPQLRELQAPSFLKGILSKLIQENKASGSHKPLLLKIAPDLEVAQIDKILEIIEELELSGIIATNTTIDHSCLTSPEQGGLSGSPLREKSNRIIRHISDTTQGKLPIVGVGGVFTADHVKEKLDAGATLVQSYTGFVYEGPFFVKQALA
ncbi:MAG: quinone-dependent dihydroorotate dehydrogenase [Verrucomicrobiota bacterium]